LKEVKTLEDWKIKIAVLWLFYAVAFLVVLVLGLGESGAIEALMAGKIGGMQITPELMLVLATLMLAPLIMAWLTLAYPKDSRNSWANVIVGTAFTVIQVIALIGTLAQPSAWAILMELSKIAAPALIVWYAWKSKQKT
jgi:hypothetical protein